jgi:hypothetical protein
MVIEQMRDPKAVYARFAERGRMMPDGVEYVSSWVEPDRRRCFQVMRCEQLSQLEEWASHWSDLVDFEFVRVITSAEAAALD